MNSTGKDPASSAAVSREDLDFAAARVRDINQQTAELHAVLARYAAMLEDDGLQQQLQILDSWMKVNAESIGTAARVLNMGPGWLDELSQRIGEATAEIERLADGRAAEDPQAPTPTQVWESVNRVLESLSALIGQAR